MTFYYLERAVLSTGMQLEVVDADGRDDMALPSGVTGAVREHDLVVAFTRPQQAQVLQHTQHSKHCNRRQQHRP